MKLIKPKFEILEQAPGIEGVYKQIEMAGRTCYKSEDKITEDSAKGFVERMIKSGHGAMLEHGTIYLAIPSAENDWMRYNFNKFSKQGKVYKVNGKDQIAVTTNLRVIVENHLMDDLQYLCEPTVYHEKRVCIRFICDRGVSHEFVRHRVFSFAQESTRYCNYSKDKFDNEITFVAPIWMDGGSYDDITADYFRQACEQSEMYYKSLLNEGWKPQQARAVLPNSLKTELVMTGFVSDWNHFFYLRDDVAAHPQAQELARPLHEEFIRRGYLEE